MYEAPVTIYETAMQTIMEEREGAIVAKIQSAFDVDVDKQELIRALQYDRNQYEKGYADGKRAAMEEIVRCKDCKYWKCWRSSEEGSGDCLLDEGVSTLATQHYDFCSYGERRDGE